MAEMVKVPRITVVSSSIAGTSRTRLMAKFCLEALSTLGVEASLLDLAALEVRAYPRSEKDPAVEAACADFNAADGWVLAAPIYNFGASGALLDFLHYALDNDLGRWKPFVLLAAQAGNRSTMALDHVARTLTYEVSAVQIGACITAVGDNSVHRGTGVIADELQTRMINQMRVLAHFAAARTQLAA